MYKRHCKHQMECRQNGVIIKQFDTYVYIRAQRDFKNCLEELAHMFFNVKLNFKVGFF